MKYPALLATLILISLPPTPAHSDFALRDGDTVVFLGDSITAARGYPKLVEEYTLLRFPKRRVTFINAGHGGDTAADGLARLRRDVFDQGASVVTVAFGVNDIGWGMKADAAHKKQYLDAIRGIVLACGERQVRVFICSPAITAEDPDRAEKGFLQTMTDEGMALARSLGAGTIDLQRGMREIQRRVLAANQSETDPKKKTLLHTEDGIHLNDLGQLAMGYVLLKGLGAPAEVSAVDIDARELKTLHSTGCQVSDLRREDDSLGFTRLDDGLPLNLGMLGALNFRFIPIPENLNRYMLKVRNLPPGQYEIHAENRVLGHASAAQLQEGLNISSMTTNGWEPGGPWEAQAAVVKELTEARDKTAVSGVFRRLYLAHHPEVAQLQTETIEADKTLVQLQRDTARPYPCRFEIRPLHEPVDLVKKNIEYGQAAGQSLVLDAYLPPNNFARPRPGILVVHGGGWSGGARNGPADILEAAMLAKAGFAAFSVEYRLVKQTHTNGPAENAYPAALDDCQRAVRWLRHHAAEYGVDPARMGALGGSAGGHLVSLLGTKDTRDNSDPELAPYSSRVQAVVDFFGPADLTQPFSRTNYGGITVQGLVDSFVGAGNVKRQREASPQFAIDTNTPPFLILQGTDDPLVWPDQSRNFHAALKKAGRDSTYIEFPGEGHGFHKPEDNTLVNQKIVEFFHRTLGGN